MNNIKVVDIINEAKDVNFILEDYEELHINYLLETSSDININFTQKNNTKVELNMCLFSNNDCNINILSTLEGNDNNCVIKFRTISEKGCINVNANIKTNGDTKGNNSLEDLKAINEGGSSNLIPTLEIDTNDVAAEHFATIGSFDKNSLFYLMSKGLSEDAAKKLLKKSFMYGIFPKEFLNKVSKGGECDE